MPVGADFVKGDCHDFDTLKVLFEKHSFQLVYHLAGQSSGEISFENPIYDLESNTTSTLHLINFCKLFSVPKMIYASTMSVYGDAEELPVSETYTNLIPKSFYAVGKLASENYLRINSNKNFQTVALRFFNIYGPGQNLENLKQGMVSIFLAQMIKSRTITIKGSGERFRDFIHIKDVIEALKALMFKDYKEDFKIYNICSGQPTKVKNLISLLESSSSFKIKHQYTDSTPGDQFGIYGSYSAFQRDFEWLPKVSFDDGIKDLVKLYEKD